MTDEVRQGPAAPSNALSESPQGSRRPWSGTHARPDRATLNHSRPIRWDRTVGSGIGAALVAELYAELELAEKRVRARRAADRAGLMVTLDALLADLLAAFGADETRFLAYARSRDAYPASRYRLRGITLTTVQTATDFLAAAGYAEHHCGRFDRDANPFGGPGGIGELSRIRATRKLQARAIDLGFVIAGIQTRQKAEVVRLRGSAPRGVTKPWLNYSDDADTTRMRQELEELNALLSATHITLPEGPHMAPEGTEDDDQPPPEPGDARLYRVFNDGSFERGGRFYGGWWMTLSKVDRARLLINSQPVVELDYSGLHPRLIYDLAGLPRPFDFEPYSLPGRLASVPREIVKTAFVQLLNTTGNIRAKAGMSVDL
jgi:hypothetical protein